jgi:ribosomal protein S6
MVVVELICGQHFVMSHSTCVYLMRMMELEADLLRYCFINADAIYTDESPMVIPSVSTW